MEKKKEPELKKILYNCKRATYLIEKRQLENITQTENYELELHLNGCFLCEVYMKQSILINDWISKVFRIKVNDLRLGSEVKKKMQKRIDAILDMKKSGRYFNLNSSADLTCKPKAKNRHTHNNGLVNYDQTAERVNI